MEYINNYPTAKTTRGKGRLWLRIALKEKNLKTLLMKLTQDQGLLRCHISLRTSYAVLTALYDCRKLYEDGALLRNSDQLEMFLGLLSPLEVLNVPITFKYVRFAVGRMGGVH